MRPGAAAVEVEDVAVFGWGEGGAWAGGDGGAELGGGAFEGACFWVADVVHVAVVGWGHGEG